jgi:LEA14-like dessication related protein
MPTQRSSSRHAGLWFLLLTLLLGGGFLYFRSAKGKKVLANKGKELLPALENATMSVGNITPEALNAQLKVDLRNQMPIRLQIDSFSYVARVDGAELAHGAKNKATVLNVNAISRLELPVSVDLSKVKEKVRTAQQDCVSVQLVMTLYTRLPVAGPQKIPVEVSKRVYIPKLPKIEVADVDVQHLGLKNGSAVVTLRVTNYNPFPFTIRRVKYNFRVSDDLTVEGTQEKDVSFRQKGTGMLPVHMSFEPKGMPKVAFKTLFKPEKTPYTLTGSVVVAAGQHNPKDMTMNFNSSGTLQDLKNILKKGKN